MDWTLSDVRVMYGSYSQGYENSSTHLENNLEQYFHANVPKFF